MPSRAASHTASATIADASAWLSRSPRARRLRANSAARNNNRRSCSAGSSLMTLRPSARKHKDAGMSRTSADLAVLGARIRTLDPDRPFATAVAIRDGLVVAVGSDAEVREACDAATETIDGRGLAVVPGLTDAHIHPLWATEFASGVEASACRGLDDWGALLRAERERVGPDAIMRTW